MNPITAITTAITLAIGIVVGLQWQAGRLQTAQETLKNEQLDRANERLAIQMAARDAIVKTTGQVKQAQTDAAVRNDRLAADLRRTAGQLDSLRSTSADTVRNASAGITACTAALATYDNVFTQCAATATTLAGDVDQWANHAVMYQDAWPK